MPRQRPAGPTVTAQIVAATIAAMICAVVAGCTATPKPSPPPSPTAASGFTMRVVTQAIGTTFELLWGPDGYLWLTEKAAGRVVRVSPADGTKQVALTLGDLDAKQGAQDGLLGLALHPNLGKGNDPYVYLAYTYREPAGRRTKIVRYTYDAASGKLAQPQDLLTAMPAGIDHQSGRLIFGADNTLYYTIGDQGGNQFGLYCQPIQAQTLPTAAQVQARDWSAYQGKVLRLNLDGSIPDGNPMLGAVRSHIYSYGHRNAQGLVASADGRLYASEQGPKTDDEVNLISAGGNYGWPRVAGFVDGRSYVYANWSAASANSCQTLTYSDYEIPQSVPTQQESSFTDAAHVPPLRTFGTVPDGYEFRTPNCRRSYYICWPTIAPSSLGYYPAGGAMPAWGQSLLMPSLKDGTVYRLPLAADGTTIGVPEPLWRTVNRYRDVAVGADGRTFYVTTDPAGLTRDRTGVPTERLDNPGVILEFRYTGPA
jgi:PQQ-dependent dehydrogenase (s-GDH family)